MIVGVFTHISQQTFHFDKVYPIRYTVLSDGSLCASAEVGRLFLLDMQQLWVILIILYKWHGSVYFFLM